MTQLVYQPAALPEDVGPLGKYVREELLRIATLVLASNEVPLIFEEPLFSTEGLMLSADGVGWNPGSGAGLYIFRGGVWIFIV